MNQIVELTKDQVHRVQNLARLTWPDTFKDILSEEQITYMLDWMYNVETLQEQISKGHLFFIIQENNQDLGFIGLEPNHPESRDLRIHKIYILPITQGKGLGQALLNFATNVIAPKYNCQRLHLNVNKYNGAVTFYQKYGFTIEKEEDIDIGNGFWMNDFVMVKKL